MTMANDRTYSLAIRLICGALGILGFAAIGFNAVRAGGIEIDFMLFASMFAGFIFVYVAMFGRNPLDRKEQEDGGNE